MIYRIPKKARNKYEFVKGMSAGASTNNAFASFSIGGNSGGGLGLSNVNANTIGSNPQIVSAINNGIQKEIDDGNLITASYLSSYYVTASELSNAGYVTASELSNAGYVTASELSNAGYVTNSALVQASYVTQQELSAMSYATTTMIDNKLQDYSKTSVDKEEDITRTVTQNDGIIVLAANDSRSTMVTLPTTGIEDGKVIYIINKTGQAFTISTTGSIIDKDSSSTARATQTISDNVIQAIYYDGEWFII